MKTTFAIALALVLTLGVVAAPAFAWAGDGRPLATPMDRQWDHWGRPGHFRHERFHDHRGFVVVRPGVPFFVAPVPTIAGPPFGAVWVPGTWAWNGFVWIWVPPHWSF